MRPRMMPWSDYYYAWLTFPHLFPCECSKNNAFFLLRQKKHFFFKGKHVLLCGMARAWLIFLNIEQQREIAGPDNTRPPIISKAKYSSNIKKGPFPLTHFLGQGWAAYVTYGPKYYDDAPGKTGMWRKKVLWKSPSQTSYFHSFKQIKFSTAFFPGVFRGKRGVGTESPITRSSTQDGVIRSCQSWANIKKPIFKARFLLQDSLVNKFFNKKSFLHQGWKDCWKLYCWYSFVNSNNINKNNTTGSIPWPRTIVPPSVRFFSCALREMNMAKKKEIVFENAFPTVYGLHPP